MRLVGERPEWHARAACRNADPDLFFPTRGEVYTEALKHCAVCPVWRDCLEYSLDNNERDGIWGGLSGRERRTLKRKRTAARRRGLDGAGITDAARAEATG